MAFATVTSTAVTTAGSTASAAPSLLLPATINADDRLLAYIRVAGAGDIGWPAGWTELFDEATDASDDQYSLAYATAAGTEDGTSISLSSANAKYAAVCYAIGAGDIPEASTRVTGTSTAPDPPSFSPTGGAKDYLWLWFGSWEGEQTSPPTGNPTNYTNPIGSNSGTAGQVTTNVRVASARRELNAATEDPPSWAISVSDDWSACVVAIPPYVPPPPGPVHKRYRRADRFLVSR